MWQNKEHNCTFRQQLQGTLQHQEGQINHSFSSVRLWQGSSVLVLTGHYPACFRCFWLQPNTPDQASQKPDGEALIQTALWQPECFLSQIKPLFMFNCSILCWSRLSLKCATTWPYTVPLVYVNVSIHFHILFFSCHVLFCVVYYVWSSGKLLKCPHCGATKIF